MSHEYLQPPEDPRELAQNRAHELCGPDFDHNQTDNHVLAELDYAAQQCNFLESTYFLSVYSAFIIPRQWDAQDSVTYVRLPELQLEGKLACYSKVSIGRLVGRGSVRALCLTFQEALLLPFFDRVESSDLLHVPVLAISNIVQTDSN
jgi:hypothetical protein